jgi:glycosyltransferase involved in cell wall biosynthesis
VDRGELRDEVGEAKRYRLVVDARMIDASGIGRYLRAALEALVREDIELVLLGEAEAIRRSCPAIVARVLEFRLSIYDPREHVALARLVPDCEVFFSPHVTTTRLKVRARKRVLTVHDAYHLSSASNFGLLKRWYSRFVYSSALKTSDVVMTVSEFTKEELAREYPDHAQRIRVVPNFVDRKLFYPDSEAPRSIEGDYLLFVGNLKPHKNIGIALEAVQLLEAEGKGLRIAVAGADRGFIHGLGGELVRLRKEKLLVFIGQPKDAELRRLYSHARALVFPSLYEGFGYPPLEAMACGCPVVCSNIPALRETCGSAASFRDPRSAADFARGIAEVLEDSLSRDSMIEAGRRRAASFSKDGFTAAIRSVVWGFLTEELRSYSR